MDDVIFGLVAIAAGALFCLRGYLAFRLVIPLWGAFVGFVLGAGIVASVTGDTFLATPAGWLAGLVGALLIAGLAYLSYEASVIIAMGSIGFALGVSAMVALDIRWTWVVILAGVVTGALLAAAAIAADLPMLLLVVLSALAGASAITAGIMLLVGTVGTSQFHDPGVTTRAADGTWWYALYLAFALVGIVTQMRAADRARGSMRESWASADRTA